MSLIPLLAGINAGTGGGGGGGDDLDTITALIRRFEVDALTGFSDNDPVGTLTDLKGNADGTSSGSQRPTFKANSGNPYLAFDGDDDEIQVAIPAMGDFAYCLVVELIDEIIYDRVFEDGKASMFTSGASIPKTLYFTISGSGCEDTALGNAPTGFLAIYVERSGTSLKMRRNGTETTFGGVSTDATSTTLHIGAYTSAGYNKQMKLKRFFVCDNNLGSTDFDTLAAYILDKDGLTL